MKKLLVALLFFGSILSANAQFLNWGVKAGMNYNANGDLTFNEETFSSDQELGYHFGLLAEIKLPLFLYIRPELLYTHTESSYDSEGTLKMDRIDIPILLGFRVFKIGRFFFGPSFQYILNTDLSASESFGNIKTVDYDDFNVAAQVGIGLNFGRFGTDIRWEAAFADSQALFEVDNFDNINEIEVDTDNMQFLLSVYWKFEKAN